jgi:FkbM family methyltransferase
MQWLQVGILMAVLGVACTESTPPDRVSHPQSKSEPEAVDFDDLLLNGTSEYAKEKEEPIIRHFFRDRPDGFFVDVGCFKPRFGSTTYYLESELGWRGIGVDAEKSYADAWKWVRPRSKFFPYAVTEKSGESVTFYAAGPIAALDKSNIKFWEKALDREIETVEVLVPTITLDDLLDREGVKKIDFLSIDINGHEPIAMSAFDIQRFRPELVHIEVHRRNRKILAEYFEKNNYRRIDEYLEYDETNWYFTPRKPAEAEKG